MDARIYGCYTRFYINPEIKPDDSDLRSEQRRAAIALGVGDARRSAPPMSRTTLEHRVQEMVVDPTLSVSGQIEAHLMALRELATLAKGGAEELSAEVYGEVLSFTMKPAEVAKVA